MNLLKKYSLHILTLAIALATVLPVLVQEGMFMDAVQYTCVARNMAEGIGSFWFPQFTALNVGGLPSFHEQPPLGFGIQALFFKVLGNGLYVERFYTLLMYVIAIVLIRTLWKHTSTEDTDRSFWFLPVLLWSICPVIIWNYSNNMLENTMTVFVLLAVFFSWQAFVIQNKFYIATFLSAVCIFCATFTKGLPGLFPLAVPFVYLLCYRNVAIKKAIGFLLLQLLVVAGIYALLLCFSEARESLYLYFVKRVMHRITDDPVVDNRLTILFDAFTQTLPALVLGALLIIVMGRKGIGNSPYKQHALFFILIGVCGILPLVLTKVQRPFYIVPAVPFIALGIAYLALPSVKKIVAHVYSKSKLISLLTAISMAAVLGVLIATAFYTGKTRRDEALLHDIKLIGSRVERMDTVCMNNELFWGNWSMRSYLMRYYYISALPEDTARRFYVRDKSKEYPAEQYCPVNAAFTDFQLLEKCKK